MTQKPLLLGILTAASRLAALGRTGSQAALSDYVLQRAGSDTHLWEALHANALAVRNPDLLQVAEARLKDVYAALDDPAEAAAKLAALKQAGAQMAKPKGAVRAGVVHRIESLTLASHNPVWHSIHVRPGMTLTVEAASEYIDIADQNNRAALLLFKCVDDSGKVIDLPPGNLAKSGHLKCYFKYLPHTGGRLRPLHSFVVPQGVTRIDIGLCSFNRKQVSERVILRPLIVKLRENTAKGAGFVPPSAQAAEISVLGWPDYPPNGKPYVMGIMDEFTAGCFEQEMNLIQPRPDNWYALAEKYRPELIFIESAWKGNFGSWQFRVAKYNNMPGPEVAQLCQYARDNGIPTIFLNKEDPVHHEKFMVSAELVDHIFTSDANMVPSYVARTGNPNVSALPFAAQPALHKPAPLAGRVARSCFAGSWYGDRHVDRDHSIGWLLRTANRHGLDIYDRNHGTGNFPFPEEFQDSIKGGLPYKELCAEYRRYRVFLNVNSVTDSPTMFSRRVFELMASGTPVVSTYAKGIEALFNSDAVWMVRNEHEAEEAIHTLMTDPAEWRRRSLEGIREVFSKHTYAHRLSEIFHHVGLARGVATDPDILLLAQAQDAASLDALARFADSQSYRRFHLCISGAEGLDDAGKVSRGNVSILPSGEPLQGAPSRVREHELVGRINPGHHYGAHYLQDLVNARRYAPDAAGWAKSLDQDRFAYGGAAARSGILWDKDAFQSRPADKDRAEIFTAPDIYLADSDQFQANSLSQHEAERG